MIISFLKLHLVSFKTLSNKVVSKNYFNGTVKYKYGVTGKRCSNPNGKF